MKSFSIILLILLSLFVLATAIGAALLENVGTDTVLRLMVSSSILTAAICRITRNI